MVPMPQLWDQRIAGRDHESEAVHDSTVLGISRDLAVYTCISKADRDPHFGRSLPIFGRHSPLFYPRVLTSAIFGSFIRKGSESKTWQMLDVVSQKSERTLVDGRNCEKYYGKNRGWLSSLRRRMPEINK
jgi:hypothetical protein